MARHRRVPQSVRDSVSGILSDTGSLERDRILPGEDPVLIVTRRCPEKRLGLAIHNVSGFRGRRTGRRHALAATGK